MAGDGSDGANVSPESEEKGGQIWGTLEELLLACAVTRHGTASWDSVAMEVQTRSPLAARPALTPHSCRLRFRHLHRRFSAAGDGDGGEVEEEDPDASAAEGWVDELRRLRVAELRRDVERCDLSIGTLQSKVKRLRQERERERARSTSDEAKPADEASADDRVSGEEPGRSCRESNSTDLKPPKHPGNVAGGGTKEEGEELEVAKREASGESAAVSKESSDVRSSASLCRRRRRGGSGKAEEEEEAASAPRPPPARSAPPPLAALVDAVAAKLGSVLQRLNDHEGEEAAAYRGTIRHHVDLEAVRRRLDRADEDDPYPAHELCRDLLLLSTNAVVFFPRGSPEHAAAVEARALVTGHASALLREPKQERAAAAAPAPAPAPAGAAIVGSLIEKGKPLIVCRKRSSIAKAAAAARKEESTAKGEDEAAPSEEEDSEDEKKTAAAAAKDRAFGPRTKKSRPRGGGAKNSSGTARNAAKAATADDADAAPDTPRKGAAGVAKKRNAVDFLKRLNQSSSSRKRSVVEQQTTTRKRGAGRKEAAGRGSGTRRGGKASGTKRGVGRPGKRGPPPATPPPSKRAKTNSRSEKSSGTGKRGGRGQVG